MSLAAPIALLWGLLAVPVVVFYILKTRQRRVSVPTLMFWGRIFQEKRPRTLWQKLRHLLSLLAQLVLVTLIVLALAQPVPVWQALEPRKVVLILDNSASMNATDVSPTRLSEAKRHARDVVDGLRYFDTMAVVAAGTEARVVCGLNDHRGTLLNAIDAVEPTDGPTRVAQAVELADWLLADEDHGQVVIVSDGSFEKAPELLADKRTSLVRVGGKENDNAAITRFQVRRSLVDPLGYEILAEVRNFASKPLETRFEMYLGVEVLDVVPLKVEPGKAWSQVFTRASADGGLLTGKLLHEDSLAADNTAWAVLPKRDPIPVTLVTKGNVFLQKVFEAIPLVRLTITDKPPESPPPGTLVVYHGQAPPNVPAGNVLVIDPPASTDLWEASEPLENPLVATQDKASPLLAHVRLDNVYMPEARKLKPVKEASVLASALSGEPIYFAVDRPDGRVLVLTVNLDRGDLPLRTAFPIMMTNAMNWFTRAGGESRHSVLAGSLASVAASGQGPVTLVSPNGRERTIKTTGEEVSVGPLDRVGVWTVRRGEMVEELPCNLASAAESDLKPAEGLPAESARLASGLGGKPMWFYLLAAVAGFMAVEWWLYQRRWIA